MLANRKTAGEGCRGKALPKKNTGQLNLCRTPRRVGSPSGLARVLEAARKGGKPVDRSAAPRNGRPASAERSKPQTAGTVKKSPTGGTVCPTALEVLRLQCGTDASVCLPDFPGDSFIVPAGSAGSGRSDTGRRLSCLNFSPTEMLTNLNHITLWNNVFIS
jgi:hypothetical protein